jgi:tetratricopeptide (TPR) repeat protein
MRKLLAATAWLLPLAASAAEPPSTYAEVAAVVELAEAGETPVDEALALVSAAPDAPLAGAALGRLRVLNGRQKAFVGLRFLEMEKGFVALNSYINSHRGDPLPHVWRAVSAYETRFALWSAASAREDLRLAIDLYRDDPSLPDQTPRCKIILGLIAKNEGDLETALRLWAEAFAADPTGRYGKEAAALLELFTG